MIKPAKYWIDKLELQKHPEGGWFREVYRSEEVFEKDSLPVRFSGSRNFSTSIYYLLEGSDFSAFHKISSDEIWHFYSGTSAVEIVTLSDQKQIRLLVGNNLENGESFQVSIEKESWFAAHLTNKKGYALVGCTVSPGFDFEDFTLGTQNDLEIKFPEHKELIRKFTIL